MLVGWAGEELRVGLTLYTDAYIVRGSMTTRQRRISDIVNNADEEFLVLTDVTVERFGGRAPARSAPFAQVNLSAVLFAVAETTVEPVPELRTPKVTETALISIPPFEVTGHIHVLADRDLRVRGGWRGTQAGADDRREPRAGTDPVAVRRYGRQARVHRVDGGGRARCGGSGPLQSRGPDGAGPRPRGPRARRPAARRIRTPGPRTRGLTTLSDRRADPGDRPTPTSHRRRRRRR